MLVLLFEWDSTCLCLLGLAHDLYLDALISDIVEHELVSCRPLVVDSSTDSNLNLLLMLARLERAIILDEIPQIIFCMELVGIWVWVLGLSKLVDVAGSNLEILLRHASVQFVAV